MNLDKLKSEVESRYGVDPRTIQIVRAPYRICPLGAHIDHQLGSVTAMAIDLAAYLAFAPSGSAQVHLTSQMLDGEVNFSVDEVPAHRTETWANYAHGAVQALKSHYSLNEGIVGVTAGEITEGGLSSSAAIGVAYLMAFEAVNDLDVSPVQNIELDRLIENDYLGLRNGILDQSAIILSRNRNLTVIDCRTVTHQLVPQSDAMPPFAILVAYSGVKDALVSTGYNNRVEECAVAAQTLLQAAGRPDVQPLLGNVSTNKYALHRDKLDDNLAKRADHFFTECERVEAGVSAWREGDLEAFGKLISQSGLSSIENYESGSEPLIDLYKVLIETDGVYGARFSGGGFRGCSIALVDPEKAESAAEHIVSAYRARQPHYAAQSDGVLICHPADGATLIKG